MSFGAVARIGILRSCADELAGIVVAQRAAMSLVTQLQSGRAHAPAVLTITFFAVLSIASSESKSKSGASAGKTVGGADAAATGTLVGSCDRSDTFHKDCFESYAPTTVADAKRSCESLSGTFLMGGCPRIDAANACFEGNEPNLFGNYHYGKDAKPLDPSDCPRGMKDFRKTPELVPANAPASCNALATDGTCTQFSSVTAKNELTCLKAGGKLVQPPVPCPSANGLVAYKLETPDGTESQYYYSTPYQGPTGTATWKREDALLVCAAVKVLGGATCTPIPFPSAAVATTTKATDKQSTAPKPKKK